MELENETGLTAHQFRTVIAEDDDRICASVVVRTSYDWHGEKLIEQEEPIWTVSPGPFETPQGEHPGDDYWLHEGVDCFLFGTARAPDGKPVEQMEVGLQVADWSRRIRVWGDRHWEKSWRKLLPSAPEPFTEMPLDVSRAFGGAGDYLGLEIPFPDNPLGRGYTYGIKDAPGLPLANIEEIDQPIRDWEQHGPVVGLGFCPMAYSERMDAGTSFDENGTLTEVRAELFNQAYPGMVAPAAKPGDRVVLDGIDANGPRSFTLPDAGLRLRLSFDEQVDEVALPIAQIGIEADDNRVFVTWRYPFRYFIKPMVVRRLQLLRET